MIFTFKLLDKPRIVDGDTIEAHIDLGFSIYTARPVRLNGVDAPETHGTVGTREKAVGIKVANIAGLWLSAQGPEHLNLRSDKIDATEKYGRILGDFFWNNDPKNCLTGYLLANKLVRPYSGQKKIPWTENELSLIECFVVS